MTHLAEKIQKKPTIAVAVLRQAWCFFALAAALCQPARAELVIEITRGAVRPIPIAIVPFGWSGAAAVAPENMSAIISADLNRSGRFEALPDSDLVAHPTEGSQVQFQNWRMVNVDNLVIGKISESGQQYSVQFQLFDVFRGNQLAGYSFNVGRQELRRVAHHISDLIYEKLTGERGAFNTQIAYVTTSGSTANKTYTLLVADSDGYNPQTILTSKEPLMSPSWSPDASQLAYVSFENKTAQIYVQELRTGTRRKLASFKGINGAPSWSPDGRFLAFEEMLIMEGSGLFAYYDFAGGEYVAWEEAVGPVSWSADGGLLAYSRQTYAATGEERLYLRPRLGSEQLLGPDYDGPAYATQPVFSPAGDQIAYLAMILKCPANQGISFDIGNPF